MEKNAKNMIPTGKKLAYSAPAFALAVVGIPIYVYIPKFYTDIVGVNIGLMGILLFGARIFDAITDPAIGLVSDRTGGPFGRRRPYIAVGALFVAITLYLLFTPPEASAQASALRFAILIFALFFFWTLAVVPYESLGPEITFDYDERTTLFVMRDGFLIAGTLFAAASPVLIGNLAGVPDTAEGQRRLFFLTGAFYAPLVAAACWWCVLAVRERPSAPKGKSPGIADGFRYVLRNRPFMILLASYTIGAIGSNLPATLILYYVEYVIQSDHAEAFLVLYLFTGILFLPAWLKAAHRFGKKKAWLASMVVNTGAFAGVFFLGAGDEILYGILVVFSGMGFGAALALPSAIQADVIDYDELLTGRRREGQYIGLWSVSRKLAAAAGVGVGLTFLGWAGYAPNAAQSEKVLLSLRVLYAAIPCLCNIAAFVIAMKYPISGEVHRRIRASIDRKRAGEPLCDPLENPAC